MAGLSGFLVSQLAVHTSVLSYTCVVAYRSGLTVGQDGCWSYRSLLTSSLCSTSEQTLALTVAVRLPTGHLRRCVCGSEAVFNGLFACVSFSGDIPYSTSTRAKTVFSLLVTQWPQRAFGVSGSCSGKFTATSLSQARSSTGGGGDWLEPNSFHAVGQTRTLR